MKKYIKSLTISLGIVALFSSVAMASVATPSGGTWTYGDVSTSGGYQMAYSYYYHPTLTHSAYAAEDNQSQSGWVTAVAGQTACSNSTTRYNPYVGLAEAKDTSMGSNVYKNSWINT